MLLTYVWLRFCGHFADKMLLSPLLGDYPGILISVKLIADLLPLFLC